ncbi:TonB-dependent receptor [Pseudomonadota bacterium]
MLTIAIAASLYGIQAFAQDPDALEQDQDQQEVEEVLEEVRVTGIRSSLAASIETKRYSDNLVEAIYSEDIGKLPDQNLAEVLENITGVQITREAGVGTGVQIRGTNANRTEINGVSTASSDTDRTGIAFEDIPAAMIAAVEVIKSSEAKTIEGSVGGTINLITTRPLDLKDTLLAVRAQGEYSSLSDSGNITPRFYGTWGDVWDTSNGEFGVILSASWSKQDVTAFRPRADRDNLVASDSGWASAQSFDYLPIQFFVQDYDNFQYETTNFVGSFEWAPNDNLKFYFDGIVNDQSREQESSRIQASGVSDLISVAAPSDYETVNFGSMLGENGTVNIGSIEAALRGVIPVEAGDADANLRMSTDTSSRKTDSSIYRLGTDWALDKFSGRVEVSKATSDSTTPTFDTTLNFQNPNVSSNSSNENGTPFVYDLSGGSLAWGIAQGEYGSPTVAQLLDPANYLLRDVNLSQDKLKNKEEAFRTDFSYDLEWSGITTIDFGYRYSKSKSVNDDYGSNLGLRNLKDSPTGNLFTSVLIQGPDNFNDADGRTLYVPDYLYINPAMVNSNPQEVIDILNAAIAANDAITGSNQGPISEPTSTVAAYFDIKEKTNAFWLQANFAAGMFRGNVGVRYVDTNIDSTGNSVVNGEVTPTTSSGSYSFWLPRINVVADVTDELVLRGSWGKDVRRPDYDALSTSVTFSTSPNPAVAIGNPGLEPEEVTSFDIGFEWYFAPQAVVSLGYFHKTRTGLFVGTVDAPYSEPGTGYRDTTAPCEGGGIFNPIADINVFGPVPGVGVCVPTATTINGAGKTKQDGLEFAFQYDLANFEDRLGWASGFGLYANYTWQKFSGGDTYLYPTSRAEQVFAAIGATDVSLRAQLLDLSENSYNITLYYEKYGLSVRTRYTWREAFRSEDFGSTTSLPWGFPVVQEDRGQLNLSINYQIGDHWSVGVDAINLTESDIEQSCVNEGALLCWQGFTDRRITFGASYVF